ncbi:sugar ABC transporter substrate-binding protein [Streptomyces sp. NPDC058867]|uniref:sugar ABC transporter substrate-binding protein n=1 Tax=unclassified Streptomyces TaxID=2593676 RepID=UPI0036BE8B96
MKSRFSSMGRPAIAGLAIGSLTMLAACGSASSTAGGSESSKTIVFSPLTLKYAAMKELSEKVEAYAKKKGYSVIVQDPKLNARDQVNQVRTAIESGKAGGAWVLTVDPAAEKSLISAAQAKGVPLVIQGTPEEFGLDGLVSGISFTAIDYEGQGRTMGEELGNCINEKLDGKASVIMEQFPPGLAGKKEIETAAKKALAETAPKAKIVTSVVVTDRTQGQTDIGSALQGNPDANAVLGSNDEGALGALGAFEAAGRKLTCMTEAGGNAETLAAVENGKIYAVVANQFQADMEQSFDHLTKMMKDPKAKGIQLRTPQSVVKAES